MLCAGMCVAEICVQKVCVQYALSSTAIARVCERWMRKGVGEGKIKKKKKRGTGKRKNGKGLRGGIKRKFYAINNASPTCPLVNAMVSGFFNPA